MTSVVRKGSCLGGKINNFKVFVFRSKLEPEPHTKRKESTSEKASQNASQDSEEKPAAEELPEKPLAESQPELGTWSDGKGEDELSPEEIQMFEQENQRLIGEMNSLFDEVRQIEGKVVEISRLQEIFTEKVLQQVKGPRGSAVLSFDLGLTDCSEPSSRSILAMQIRQYHVLLVSHTTQRTLAKLPVTPQQPSGVQS